MSLWKYLTGATLFMLGFFAYGLVVVLKQRRLSEIQKDFIDNVTHELKTPLATLRLSAEAIRKGNDPTKTMKYAEIIDQETRRLEQQIDQILNASVLERSGSIVKHTLNIDNYFLSLGEQLQLSHPFINWAMSFEQIGNVEMDRNGLDTVLHNLIDNAVKYGKGKVKLSAFVDKSYLEIHVGDNGPGIPKKYQKNIYQKFFRVPSENIHDVKGHGLGMYLVKESINKLKGQISLVSGEDGTEFVIRIPI
jgi:two-component system phosphate regulon sensor histidine kinase PhoR